MLRKYSFALIAFMAMVLFFSCHKAKHNKLTVKNFEVLCDTILLDSIYKNYEENIYIPIRFIKNNDTITARMRLRGDSSRKYDKKSLKIVFNNDTLPEGEHKKINLNSEWTDKSYIRQLLSSKLMQDAGVICFDSYLVKLKLNGQFWGIYLQVENIDKAFLSKNGLDKKGNLYKATKDGACLSHFDDIKVKWEKKTNKKAPWNDLQLLINQLDTVSIKHYKNYLQETFEYDKLVTIVAMNMLLQNGSTYYHNYYLFHDINGNNKWQMLPWDLDKTLSNYNWKPYKYHETSSNWESDNPLIEKMFLNHDIMVDVKAKIHSLSKDIFNSHNIAPIINSIARSLKNYIALDNSDQINDISEWEKAIKNEKKYFKKQSEYILNQLNNLPKSFLLYRHEKPIARNITLKWNASKAEGNLKYKLIYGKHFLLKEQESVIIDNIEDTVCQLVDLKPGKYYWKVYVSDGVNSVEGFNTKSSFEVLPESKTIISNDTVLAFKKTPHYVNDTWVIKEGCTLTIEPGCEIRLAESAKILNYGNIIALGSINDSIHFIPQHNIWDQINNYSANSIVRFEYCSFTDGFFRSWNANVTFKNCMFTLHNKRLWNNGERTGALWFHKGNLLIDSCVFENNIISKGEGINIHYTKAQIVNSVFKQLADAIEYINVSEGKIQGNFIFDSPDDAIDLNGCSNVSISDNIIINNHDKAISIGTEQYGPSTNILVNNNLLVGNGCGISVKDSSNCRIQSSSFINNGIAIEAKIKSNWKKYNIGGTTELTNCLFHNNKELCKFDESSAVNVNGSVSSGSIIEGNSNFMVKTIEFKNIDSLNYNTNFEKGSKFNNESIRKAFMYFN